MKVGSQGKSASEMTIEDRIGKVHMVDKYLKVVTYGPAGTGKTTFACTFPKPILLLDIRDRGTDSVADVDGVDVLQVEDWYDFEDAYWMLKKRKNYRSVITDTVSQLQTLAMVKVLGEKKKKIDKDAGNWGTLTKGDWGDVASLMKEWLHNYRDLDMAVCFIAQHRTFNIGEEEEEGAIAPEIGPRLMPSVAQSMNADVSVIGSTFIRERFERVKGERKEKRHVEYCMRLGPHAFYVTKVRKPKTIIAPDFIVDPTYNKIEEIRSGKKLKRDSEASGDREHGGSRSGRRVTSS